MIRLGLLFVLVGTTHSIAGTIRSDRPDQLYLDLANQPEFASVGRITWNESSSGFLGSGTLISPEWVLTAAHVVDGTNGFGGGISNFTFDVGGQSIAADELIAHPDWLSSGGESNLFAGFDIGLVRLSEPVLNVGPAVLNTGRDELGQVATIVGFGTTGTGETGAVLPGGTRRAGQNVIDAVGQNVTPGSVIAPPTDQIVTIDLDEPGDPSESTLGSSVPLDLEYLTAPGDSGGGLFLGSGEGVELAAVTSLGSTFDLDGANSDYGDRASFTRVSSFIDFIEETTGLNLTGPRLAGDFTRDGVVDAADFGLLSAQFGVSGLNLSSDGNNDGVVNALDYLSFRDSLSTPSAILAPAAVPEPSALLLAFVWVAQQAARRRRLAR